MTQISIDAAVDIHQVKDKYQQVGKIGRVIHMRTLDVGQEPRSRSPYSTVAKRRMTRRRNRPKVANRRAKLLFAKKDSVVPKGMKRRRLPTTTVTRIMNAVYLAWIKCWLLASLDTLVSASLILLSQFDPFFCPFVTFC